MAEKMGVKEEFYHDFSVAFGPFKPDSPRVSIALWAASWALERAAKAVSNADPLLAEGPYWENAETDEIAYGVQEYLAKQVTTLKSELEAQDE